MFPKGSLLVADISRAIPDVKEGPEMTKIGNAWLTQKSYCPNSTTLLSSNSLDFESFWGLFFIAGLATLLALLIFMSIVLKTNWHVITSSTGSLWEKITDLGSPFYQGDLNSYPFQTDKLQDENFSDGRHESQVVHASPKTLCPCSSSSYSDNTKNNFLNKQGMVSMEHEYPAAIDQGVLEITIDELVNVNQDRLATKEP